MLFPVGGSGSRQRSRLFPGAGTPAADQTDPPATTASERHHGREAQTETHGQEKQGKSDRGTEVVA